MSDLLVEVRGLRADVQNMQRALLGDEHTPGVYEKLRTMDREHRGMMIRWGTMFGFIGTCAGWIAEWFTSGQRH